MPATTKPRKRKDRSKAMFVDGYGFRPLRELFTMLSPFEFGMFWHLGATAASVLNMKIPINLCAADGIRLVLDKLNTCLKAKADSYATTGKAVHISK